MVLTSEDQRSEALLVRGDSAGLARLGGLVVHPDPHASITKQHRLASERAVQVRGIQLAQPRPFGGPLTTVRGQLFLLKLVEPIH